MQILDVSQAGFNPRRIASRNLLSGLARCGYCGKAPVGQEAKAAELGNPSVISFSMGRSLKKLWPVKGKHYETDWFSVSSSLVGIGGQFPNYFLRRRG